MDDIEAREKLHEHDLRCPVCGEEVGQDSDGLSCVHHGLMRETWPGRRRCSCGVALTVLEPVKARRRQ